MGILTIIFDYYIIKVFQFSFQFWRNCVGIDPPDQARWSQIVLKIPHPNYELINVCRMEETTAKSTQNKFLLKNVTSIFLFTSLVFLHKKSP
jgi:hypothetical protein